MARKPEDEGLLLPHDAACMFPMMSESELDQLAADIQQCGQHEPIIMHEGLILDGRNRYAACQIADVDPKFTTWDGKNAKGETCSPFAFVWSLNGERRQLEASQRGAIFIKVATADEAWIAARAAEAEAANRARSNAAKAQIADQPRQADGRVGGNVATHPEPESAPKSKPSGGKTRKAIAAGAGISPRTSQDLLTVQKKRPDLFEKVAAGEITAPEAKRTIKREEIKAKAEEAKAATPVGPRVYRSMADLTWAVSGRTEKPFACIYADPPWPYENQGTRGATDNQYVTMSMEDIYALPVKDIAEPDAFLFLWATSTLLPEAFECLREWGFAYKSTLVWDKSPRFGLGNYFRVCTEFLLVGTRGKPTWLRKDVPSIYRGGAGEHSAKPAEIRSLVESCAMGPHVELFARTTAERWASMGNEVTAAAAEEVKA